MGNIAHNTNEWVLFDKSMWERRVNLGGLELKVGFAESPPYISVNNATGQATGFYADVASMLAAYYNFTIKYIESPFHGSLMINASNNQVMESGRPESWNGVVGLLARK